MKKSQNHFYTSYSTVPDKLLLKVLSEVINFVLDAKIKKYIRFSKGFLSWSFVGHTKIFFISKAFFNTAYFFIIKYLLTNLVFKCNICILMTVDPTQFWVNFLIYLFEFKNIKPFTFHGLTYHGVLRFSDDICTLNKHIEF